MNRGSSRRGYALALVVIFITIVNLFFVLAWKHFTTAIRVQNTFQTAKQRDEGALVALATGIAQLETVPPTVDATSGGYCYGITIGGRQFKVTYSGSYDPENTDPQSIGVSVLYQAVPDPLLRDLRTEYPDRVPPP